MTAKDGIGHKIAPPPNAASGLYDMARKNHSGQASHRLSSVIGNLAG